MIRTVLGAILLIFGALDLWKWGWHVLFEMPQLIVGILLLVVGGGLVSSGRRLQP